MVIITRSGTQDPYSEPLYGLHGQYSLSGEVAIPYFVSLMPIERAIDELQIAEEIAPDLDNQWSLSELFQREVNRDRVTTEMVDGYLKVKNKLKFFNAVTVMLMPRDPESGRPDDRFGRVKTNPPPIPWSASAEDDAAFVESDSASFVDGLQYNVIQDQARLRWDPSQVHAVVVDGQHRMVALREFRNKDGGGSLTQDQKRTKLTVLFLLLEKGCGFKHGLDKKSARIPVISREIFTDLNKNAKPVDRARELILDDWNIIARCVRRLVTNTTATNSATELPLSLVRWQDPINRFDGGYYLNSLVHLEMSLLSLLDLPTISNPMEPRQAEKYMKACREMFNDGAEFKDPKNEGWTLQQAYGQLYLDEEEEPISPFTRLPNNFLDLAVEGFCRHHKPWIIRVLTEFRPYATLLAYAHEKDLIVGIFGKYHAQTKKHRDTLRLGFQKAGDERWHEREIKLHVDEIEKIKGIKGEGETSNKDVDWSFKAIFQKALLRLAKVVCFDYKGEDERLGNLDDFLKVMNALHERGVFRVGMELESETPYLGLWTFIGLNPASGTIKVSKKVEDNMLAALRLAFYANRKNALDRRAGKESLSSRRLVQFFAAGSNCTHWPACDSAVVSLKAAFDNKSFHGADLETIAPETRDESLRKRLAAFVDAVRLASE